MKIISRIGIFTYFSFHFIVIIILNWNCVIYENRNAKSVNEFTSKALPKNKTRNFHRIYSKRKTFSFSFFFLLFCFEYFFFPFSYCLVWISRRLKSFSTLFISFHFMHDSWIIFAFVFIFVSFFFTFCLCLFCRRRQVQSSLFSLLHPFDISPKAIDVLKRMNYKWNKM